MKAKFMQNTPVSPPNKLPISMRMPDGLIHWLKQQAAQNHRSFTSEIIHRLTTMQIQEEKAHG